MSASGTLTGSTTGAIQRSVRAIDRLALAHDASHYLLVPDAVATPRSADEIAELFAESHTTGRQLTFRSGGTSLSGQAVTDGLLVDTRTKFRRITVLDGGERVRLQPGVTVRQANARLARTAHRLGPDPASEIACTIGGVVANNSSGMSCGTEQNTYRTLESMIFVLPSGTVIDTAEANADERLREREPELHAGIAELSERVRADAASVATIRRLFAMKNTMGYGVNAFLDFDAPVDVLAHLMIGSEGTLGFVAEATFRTVDVLPEVVTGLAIFPTLAAATGALPALVATQPSAVELMDATSLRVAQAQPDAPAELTALAVDGHAALLIEYQAATPARLAEASARAASVLEGLETSSPIVLTGDAGTRADLWHIRKGLYTAVAGARPSGTTALLEDVVVPVAELLDTCTALIELFDRYEYEESVIFGHAKDGNIHFMLNERFDDPSSVARYTRFTEDMVGVILDHGGSLKAEHGTGRIMAPFVRAQYGDELYAVMVRVKELCDPSGLLNPGVVLSEDPTSYLNHLKLVPTVESEVDRCVECGYCEPVCPSNQLTMTPRQRIVVRREMKRAELTGDTALLAELQRDYGYDAVETCAVDGMCQTACPVTINTGDLVRRLRQENAGALEQAGWKTAAKHWSATSRVGGVALSIADALPAPLVTAVTDGARAVLGAETVPRYDRGLPGGGKARRPLDASNPIAVYFPACIGTMFGPADRGEGVTSAFLTLCERADVAVRVPEGIGSFCCGTPWKSKGLSRGYDEMGATVLPALWAASDEGRLPVVCDASSCTEGLTVMRDLVDAHGGRYAALRLVDAVEFTTEHLLPALRVTRRIPSLALHHTCSSTQLGTNDRMTAIASAIADDVVIPVDWGCCAFAGDRGLLHPELTASATAAEAAEVAASGATAFASSNRTCEIGMSRATGESYQHLIELLEQATRTT